MAAKQTKKTTDEQLKERIRKILEKNHTIGSLTELGRKLGYKKLSGSTAKKIRKLLPGIEEYLKKGKAVKSLQKSKPKKRGKKTAKTSKPSKKITVPDICPFRHSEDKISSYALVFSVLYHYARKKFISRSELLEKLKAVSPKDPRLLSYDITVVCSSDKEGIKRHRSINSKTSDVYFVEKRNGGLRLVLR